jgi:hypothetical protein
MTIEENGHMAKKVKRAKAPTGARPVLQFRVHEGLYESLREEAARKRLTISEAAADILSRYQSEKELFPGIQQMMMLFASAFWHAAKMTAINRNLAYGYTEGETAAWLRDPECYRAGVLAVMNSLLNGYAISSEAEKARTIKAIVASVVASK